MNFVIPELCAPECDNILVNFSGGRTSAWMGKLIKESQMFRNKRLLFSFQNTGKEAEATLEFVRRCDAEFGFETIWIEAVVNMERGVGNGYKVVTFDTAARRGEPFEAMIQKHGIPNAAMPHCTRELKTTPSVKLAKDYFNGEPYCIALGIRYDEFSRVKRRPRLIYPMAALGLNVRDVRAFWNAQPFDLQLRDYQGNCDLCWKKSLRKQLTILKENPSVADWWQEMERKYSQLDVHDKGVVANFHRKGASTEDLLRMSKEPFVPSTDPFWKAQACDAMDKESPCACMNSEDGQDLFDF